MQKNNILINSFLETVRKYPDRPALEIGETCYSYEALKDIAQEISMGIIHATSDDSPLIGVLADKSLTAYAGILGALMASNGYVPLNPRFPHERNLMILESSGVQTLIVGAESLDYLKQWLPVIKAPKLFFFPELHEVNELANKYPEHQFLSRKEMKAENKVNASVDQSAIAYLLFTSGTTGRPKGVPVSNLNVIAYLDYITGRYEFNEHDRFSQTFDLTFDLSVHDLFVCWAVGACLCIPSSNSSFAMSKYLRESKLTVWFSVPSMASLMKKMRLLRKDAYQSLRFSFFCGEPFHVHIAEAWQEAASNSRIINLYGPTEATISVSDYECSSEKKSRNGIISIGKVFDTQAFRIVDEDMNAVQGSPQGELVLSGSQVVDGYYKDDLNTIRSFVNIPGEPGRTWYRTGDMVLKDEEDDLFFMGRTDHEVKISGYRVNLLEVEHHIINYTGHDMVVVVSTVENDLNRIVAFLTEPPHSKYKEADIIKSCKDILPWYMIPEKIIFVDEMPLNTSGKLDRNSLIEMYL